MSQGGKKLDDLTRLEEGCASMLLRGGGGATDSGLRVLELLAVDVDSLCLLLPQVLLSHLHIHSTIVSVLSRN
jgi:hypothetical protein